MVTAIIILSVFVVVQHFAWAHLWIEVKGLKNSTHQVQFVNMPKGEFQNISEDLKAKLQEEPFGNVM